MVAIRFLHTIKYNEILTVGSNYVGSTLAEATLSTSRTVANLLD